MDSVVEEVLEQVRRGTPISAIAILVEKGRRHQKVLKALRRICFQIPTVYQFWMMSGETFSCSSISPTIPMPQKARMMMKVYLTRL